MSLLTGSALRVNGSGLASPPVDQRRVGCRRLLRHRDRVRNRGCLGDAVSRVQPVDAAGGDYAAADPENRDDRDTAGWWDIVRGSAFPGGETGLADSGAAFDGQGKAFEGEVARKNVRSPLHGCASCRHPSGARPAKRQPCFPRYPFPRASLPGPVRSTTPATTPKMPTLSCPQPSPTATQHSRCCARPWQRIGRPTRKPSGSECRAHTRISHAASRSASTGPRAGADHPSSAVASNARATFLAGRQVMR